MKQTMKKSTILINMCSALMLMAGIYNLVRCTQIGTQRRSNWARTSHNLRYARGHFELGIKRWTTPYLFQLNDGSSLHLHCDPFDYANACLDEIAQRIDQRPVSISFYEHLDPDTKRPFDLIMSIRDDNKIYLKFADRKQSVQSYQDENP